MSYKKYIPTFKEKSFYEIDFLKYFNYGYRTILCDLDNTLVTYDIINADALLIEKIEEVKRLGFEFIIVSNSNTKRVEPFSKTLNVKFLANALKPLTLKKNKLNLNNKTLFIGDQLLTDIVFSNKLKIDSVLVDTLNKNNELKRTKINKLRERRILNKIRKSNNDAYNLIIGKNNE